MASVAAEPPPANAARDARAWSRRDGLALGAVVATALLLRLWHLREIAAHDPFFANPSLDPQVYHDAAVALASGAAAADLSVIPSLYPHFLAAIYAVTGPSFLAAKAVQAVLGAASCGLTYALARRFFDWRVAAVAGAIAAFHGMAIFYGGTLTIANAVVPLTLVSLLCAERGLRRPGSAAWLATGVLVGVTALFRPNALLLAGPLAAWIPFGLPAGTPGLRRASAVAALAVGVALPLLPATATGVFLRSDWRGGVNFFIGNNPAAVGTFRPPVLRPDMRVDHPVVMRREYQRVAEEQSGRALSPEETSSFWLRAGLAFVREHPGAWLRLEARKLALFWNALEPWTVRSFTVSQSFSAVLRLPLVTYGAIAPLALVGLWLTRRSWRRLMPLYLAVGTALATALLFFVTARYRLPAVPVLGVFAAAAVVEIADAVAARRLRAAATAACGVAVLAWAVHRPLLPDNLNVAYYNLGNRYKALGQWDLAVDAYRRSLAGNPASISTWNNLGLVLEGAGRDREAVAVWQQIHAWAVARGVERYRERAARRLGGLGAPLAPAAAAPEPPEPAVPGGSK